MDLCSLTPALSARSKRGEGEGMHNAPRRRKPTPLPSSGPPKAERKRSSEGGPPPSRPAASP
eukprot:5268757-Lingulodinium_polyedra.AAC.1